MHPFRILVGILLMSIGLFFLILYTNLFSLGYSFLDFVHFISRKVECLLFLVGLFLLINGMGGTIKHVLLLRHSSKLWK